jgi:hypothetical protein
MLQGNFSQLLSSSGQLVTIYDPGTTRQQPDGTYVRTPLAGNAIPTSQINPIATKLITYYPKPTGPRVGPGNLRNYSVLEPQVMSYTAVLGKLDFHVSQKSNISFRYGQTPWYSTPSVVWGTNAAEPAS